MDTVDRLLARKKRTLPANWKQSRECPNCEVGADRPKCFFDMGPSCPRNDPDAYDESPYVYVPDKDCHEAADEITRLRKERDEARAALASVRDAIVRADPDVLTCTLWMPDSTSETVVDFIDAALPPPEATK